MYNIIRNDNPEWFTLNPLWKLEQYTYAKTNYFTRHNKDIINNIVQEYQSTGGAIPLRSLAKKHNVSMQTVDRILAANLPDIKWNLKHIKYMLWGKYIKDLQRLKQGKVNEFEATQLINKIIDEGFDPRISEEIRDFFDENKGHVKDLLINKLHLRDTVNNWISRNHKEGPYEKVKAPTGKGSPSSFISNREEYEEPEIVDPQGLQPRERYNLWADKERLQEIANAYKSQTKGGLGLTSKEITEQFGIGIGQFKKIKDMYRIPTRNRMQQTYEDRLRNGEQLPSYKKWLNQYQQDMYQQKLRNSVEYSRNRRQTDPEFAEKNRQYQRDRYRKLREQEMEVAAASCNWYRRLKIAHMFHGEFWIDDSGNAMAADGDIGDMNHEGHVIQTILSTYDLDYESNGVDIEDPNFIREFVDDEFEECVDLLVSQGNMTEEEKAAAFADPDGDAPTGMPWKDEVADLIDIGDVLRIKGASEDEVEMVSYNGDARLFAMKHWGWKRLEGLRVETWVLTPNDMKVIASGLYDAYGDEIPDEDHETGDDIEIGVFTHSNQKFTYMSYSELENGGVEQKIDPITQTTQDAYQNALDQVDRPSNPYYKGWE